VLNGKRVGLSFARDISKSYIDIIAYIGYNICMYSVKEAAQKMGMSERHLRWLLAKGAVNGKKLGHDWVVLSLDYKRKRKPKGGCL